MGKKTLILIIPHSFRTIFNKKPASKLIERIFSDPNRIRTYDLQIRNLLLYPAELWDLIV